MSIVSNAQPQYLNIPCCAVCLSNIVDTKTFIQFSACDIIIFRVAELRVCSSLHTLNWNRTNERNKNHKWRNLCNFRAKTKKHWVILMSSSLFVSEQNTCCFVAISHTSKFRKESFALKLNNAVKHFEKDTNGSELVYSPFNKKKKSQRKRRKAKKAQKLLCCDSFFLFVSVVAYPHFFAIAFCSTPTQDFWKEHNEWYSLHFDCIWSCNLGISTFHLNEFIIVRLQFIKTRRNLFSAKSSNWIDEKREIYSLANECIFN